MTTPTITKSPRSVKAVIAISLLLLAGISLASCGRSILKNLFGPPSATLTESYQQHAASTGFSHQLFDQVLKAHVDENGWVDYASLNKDAAALDTYISSLATAPFEQMDRDEKLALLINSYNAFTLRLILDYWDSGNLHSIKDIPAADRWDAKQWKIAGNFWSLSDIEHQQIRNHFNEPRIHFALVCAAYSCPKLHNEAFTADQLERQLENQTKYAHNHDRWFRSDATNNQIEITALYDWYSGDFVKNAGSVLSYVARYKPQINLSDPPAVSYLNYDWKLNDIRNAPADHFQADHTKLK
jgi:hypothetical protein